MKQHLVTIVTLLAGVTASWAQTNAPIEPTGLPPVTVIGEATDLAQLETVSASVVAGDMFEWGGYHNTRELTAIAPNTSLFDGNNQRTPRFSVRGFRENNFLIGEPAVGLYVDDMPYLDVASRGLPLYDIEQAEFYRGPQGTMFGAGGIGGVMNIRTLQPDNHWRGSVTAGYGSYNEMNFQGGISGPIVTNQLYFGISGMFGQSDGFVNNLNLGTDADSRETLSGRAVLRWTPTENWDIALTLTADRFRDGFVPTYYPTTDAGPYDVSRTFDGYNDTDAFGQAIRVRYATEDFNVVSVTTHRDWEQDLLQDFDFTAAQLLDGFSRPEVETWSQELRLESPNTGERTRWVGGLFFADNTINTDSGSVVYPPLAPIPTTQQTLAEQQAQTYAAFGQATFATTEKLDLVAGLRLNHEQRDISRQRNFINGFGTFPAAAPYSTDFDDTVVLPKAGAAWHFNDDMLGYFNFSEGYQSGGFNASNDDPVASRFDPATSWNYELGVKSDWYESKLNANASVFYSDADDYQVYRLNAADPAQAYLQNADNADLMGGELELTVRPAQGWEFTGGVGYTHAEYDRYFDPVNGTSFDGNTISFVPEWTANFAGQYRFPFGLYLRLEVQTLGDYYLTEDNTAKQGAFSLLNARIGYERRNWGIHVFGRNLLDEEYAGNALDLRSGATPDQLVIQPGTPVAVGIALSARF